MKIKQFDVVELRNENKAVILEIYKRNKYYAEIVNSYGVTKERRIITDNEIKNIVYSKEKVR